MLGMNLLDPDAIEGSGGNALGLSLLPAQTVFHAEKKTVQMEGILSSIIIQGEMRLCGFKIHLGRTSLESSCVSPFLLLDDGRADGAISGDRKVMGTYLHGIFHNRLFTRYLFNQIAVKKGWVK